MASRHKCPRIKIVQIKQIFLCEDEADAEYYKLTLLIGFYLWKASPLLLQFSNCEACWKTGYKFIKETQLNPALEAILAAEPQLQHAFCVCFTWNEIENKKIYALYGSKKKFLNDHDQDHLFVISEVTNLGSYSSSHQGMCRAAPWEAVFYKQTDRDLYRKRWSKTAGLYTCTGRKRLKKKQLCLVRGTPATAVLAMLRPLLHPASHPLCQLPNLMQIIFLLKPADFFEMTDAQTAKM